MARRESLNVENARLAAHCAALEAEYKGLWRKYRAVVGERDRGARRIRTLEQLVESLRATVAKTQGTLRELRHLHFGDKSERGPVGGRRGAEPTAAAATRAGTGTAQPGEGEAPTRTAGKRRGGQPGHTGHGRRVVPGLPHVTHICTLPEDERRCANCGTPYAPVRGWFARTVVLDWTVHLFYHLYLRQRYRRDCDCVGPKGVLTAPRPAKVVAKGLLAPRAIARICVEKFWFGHPLHRMLRALALEVPTLPFSQGGATRTLRSILPLLEPLYAAIRQRVREQSLLSADETTATVLPGDADTRDEDESQGAAEQVAPSEAAGDGSTQPHRKRWWTWAFKAKDAVAFAVAQRRDTQAACAFFGWDLKKPPAQPLLILLTDCYSVYKTLARFGWVVPAYCWSHVRRKFVEAARTENSPVVSRWAESWRQQIATLYTLNEARRKADADSPARAAALRAHAATLRTAAEQELHEHEQHTRPLRPRQTKALRTLLRHWSGLTLFLDHPEVPMDNNEMERILRGTVVGRKNYLFFGSRWSAHLAEVLWSILATAVLNDLNPLTYLTAYLQACAANGGQPLSGAALDRFLPWRATATDRAASSQPLPSLPPAAFAPHTPAPRRRRPPCRCTVPAVAAAPAPAEIDSS